MLKKLMYNPKIAAVTLAAPGLLFLFIFIVMPFIIAFFYSFTDRLLVQSPNLKMSYVGLRNYIRVFQDPVFLKSFLNNLYFAVVAVPIQLVLSLGMAILVNNKVKGIGFFRTIFFSPIVIPLVVVAIAWSILFTPGASGLLNIILSKLTFGVFRPLDWLFDKNVALDGIIIMSVWMSVGAQMIILLAGLQSVSQDLMEAAKIDGAGVWKRFINVTVPQIRNTIIFCVLTSTIGSFKVFGQVFVLTQGRPQNSTSTIVYMIYEKGFINQQLGYSSALAVVVFIIIGLLSYVQQYIMKFSD